MSDKIYKQLISDIILVVLKILDMPLCQFACFSPSIAAMLKPVT